MSEAAQRAPSPQTMLATENYASRPAKKERSREASAVPQTMSVLRSYVAPTSPLRLEAWSTGEQREATVGSMVYGGPCGRGEARLSARALPKDAQHFEAIINIVPASISLRWGSRWSKTQRAKRAPSPCFAPDGPGNHERSREASGGRLSGDPWQSK